jgi:anaerobic ribonucleoside-triphosphate reductase activating protein
MNYIPEQVFVGLQEIPNEISLIIPIVGCGHKCTGCHSPEYQNASNGIQLTDEKYIELLGKYEDKVSCICFFGGEYNIDWHLWQAKCWGFKTALYSGYTSIDIPICLMDRLDYIKTGSYVKELGGLDKKSTNQKMYMYTESGFVDITSEFWR